MDSTGDDANRRRGNDESVKTVLAALAVNSILFGGKLTAYFMSGGLGEAPFAMLAEVLHSLGDSTAQAFLLIGIYKASRKADKMFPFGYGRERFRWSFASSGIVFILAGATILQGILGIAKGTEPHIDRVSLILFVCAAFAEGTVWCIAFRGIRKEMKRHRQSFRQYLKETSNPSGVAVLLEDAVAVTGIAVALGGIGLVKLTGSPVYDGVASILIGILMGVMAWYLFDLNGKLLVGRASHETEFRIRRILENTPLVKEIREVKAVFVGVEQVRAHVVIVLNEQEVQKLVIDHLNGDAERLITNSSEKGIGTIMRVHNYIKNKITDEVELKLWQGCPELAYLDLKEEEISEQDVAPTN